MGVHGITRALGTRTTTAHLRVLFWGERSQRRRAAWSNQGGPLGEFFYIRGEPNKLSNVALERAGILQVGGAWYQADNGKPADDPDELVPKYLPSIPLDPYDGKPFHCRLLRGEEIMWPPEPDANQPARLHKEDFAGSGRLVERRRRQDGRRRPSPSRSVLPAARVRRRPHFPGSTAAPSKIKASGGVYPRRFKPGRG